MQEHRRSSVSAQDETQLVSRRQSRHGHSAPPVARAATAQALTLRDDTILRALATYGFLTCGHVTCLFYRSSSLAYARRRMKRLADAGYAQRLKLPNAGAGNTPWVYALASKGRAYLDATGGYEAPLPRASACAERSYLFLAHTLAITDVLIAAALLPRQVPDITLADVRPERLLRHAPVRVRLDAREQVMVIPDAWLDFRVRRHTQVAVVLELDRGTEEQRAFKRKLHALLAYAHGPYQAAFGTPSITVAFATTAGQARVERMRQWCEQVLRGQAADQDADLFRFTALPAAAPDPRRLFLAPVWQQPFAAQPRPLIDSQPASRA